MVSPVKERVMIQRLREFGFEGPIKIGVGRHSRKHPFMQRGEQHLSLPNHHGTNGGQKDYSVKLVKTLLKQAGITEADWDARA
jgi:hypothetical protein